MATAAIDTAPPPPTGPRFAARHRGDRIVFPGLVAAVWAAILAGFVPSILGHVREQGFVYPPIVHLHALAFVGWLILLSVQVALIASARVTLHRRLGIAGAALAGAMVMLGPIVALVRGRAAFGTPFWDPAFLSIEFAIMLTFAVLVGAALALRRDAAAHKRLILLATFCLTAAGFGRIFGIVLPDLPGPGWPGMAVRIALGPDLLITALGGYDLATRGRLHPAYLIATAGIAVGQASAIALYFTPAWVRFATRLLGH